jgi:hypothetical protein
MNSSAFIIQRWWRKIILKLKLKNEENEKNIVILR